MLFRSFVHQRIATGASHSLDDSQLVTSCCTVLYTFTAFVNIRSNLASRTKCLNCWFLFRLCCWLVKVTRYHGIVYPLYNNIHILRCVGSLLKYIEWSVLKDSPAFQLIAMHGNTLREWYCTDSANTHTNKHTLRYCISAFISCNSHCESALSLKGVGTNQAFALGILLCWCFCFNNIYIVSHTKRLRTPWLWYRAFTHGRYTHTQPSLAASLDSILMLDSIIHVDHILCYYTQNAKNHILQQYVHIHTHTNVILNYT
jgi:hypothetical protein